MDIPPGYTHSIENVGTTETGHTVLGQRGLRPGPAGHVLPPGLDLPRSRFRLRMKVATVVGTRPEIIRLSRVIAALDRYMEHVLSIPARTTTTS